MRTPSYPKAAPGAAIAKLPDAEIDEVLVWSGLLGAAQLTARQRVQVRMLVEECRGHRRAAAGVSGSGDSEEAGEPGVAGGDQEVAA